MKHLLLIFILLPVYVMCQNINEIHGKKIIVLVDSLGMAIPFDKPIEISEYDTVIYQQVNYDTLWQCDREVDTIYTIGNLYDTLRDNDKHYNDSIWAASIFGDTIPVFNDSPDSLMKIEYLIDSTITDTTISQKDSYKEYINYILYFYYDIDYYEDGDLFVMIKPKDNNEKFL